MIRPTIRTIGRWGLAIAVVAFAPRLMHAQDVAVPHDSGAMPAATADVQSLDAIMHSIYDAISGPAGPRNWERFYSLFAPGARLIPTRHDSTTGATHLQVLTPEDFAHFAAKVFVKQPFYEREISREVNTYGAITQVFSTYASFHAPDDAKPFARGINSFQLFNDGTRWYVVTIYWDAERPGNPIPKRYLASAKPSP